MKLFSKLNSNEYNNRLEAILDKKNYNLEVKNLLLSMLYKIENGYNDYSKVKMDAYSKEDFIKKILQIIEEQCLTIDVVTPQTAIAKPLADENIICKTDPQRGSILVYANENNLLYSLFQMNYEYEQLIKKDKLKKKKEEDILINDAIKEFAQKAVSISQSEVIRDFDGWSWNSNLKSQEEIEINLIYQTILILKGEKETEKMLNTDMDLQKIMFDNNQFRKLAYITILIQMARRDRKLKKELERIYLEEKNYLGIIANRTKFIEYSTEQKKKLNKEIKEIDEMLNDSQKLKKEYEKRNAKLPNEQKIFSISHLADKLEKERAEKLVQIQENNKILEPKEYIKEQSNLEYTVNMLEIIVNGANNVENARAQTIEFEKEFLREFTARIDEADKQSLLKQIYNLRYYCLIPINIKEKMKDLSGLKSLINDAINELIDNGIDKGILSNISNSISVCNKVLKNMFISKVVNLQELEILISQEKGTPQNNIKIKVYDVKDSYVTYNETIENVKLLNIKLNRRIKIFL